MNHDLSFDKISRKESIRDKIVLVLNMPKKILKLRKGISSMRSGQIHKKVSGNNEARM